MKNERDYSVDILRIIACMMVVVMHVSAQLWGIFDTNSKQWMVLNIYDSAVRSAVPLFVMISGAMMLDPNRDLKISRLFRKNIMRIFIAYIFWSIFYAIWGFWCEGKLTGSECLKPLISQIIESHPRLWFLPMIMMMYLLVPILHPAIKKGGKAVCKYILFLFLVFGILKVTILLFEPAAYVSTIVNKIGFNRAISYTGYFVLGYYLYNTSIKRKIKIVLYIFAGVSVLICVVGTYELSTLWNKKTLILYDNFSIFTLVEAVAIFIFGCGICKKKLLDEKKKKRIRVISDTTFGIYLVHTFYITLLEINGLDTSVFNTIISVPVISIVVFLLSLITILIIKKIPYLSKYIV